MPSPLCSDGRTGRSAARDSRGLREVPRALHEAVRGRLAAADRCAHTGPPAGLRLCLLLAVVAHSTRAAAPALRARALSRARLRARLPAPSQRPLPLASPASYSSEFESESESRCTGARWRSARSCCERQCDDDDEAAEQQPVERELFAQLLALCAAFRAAREKLRTGMNTENYY